LPQKNNVIGIDLGIKDYCIYSFGQKTRPLKPLQNNLKRLGKLNQSLSKKKKNSNNFKKAKINLSKLHCAIANQRKDFLHQVSKEIINENQVICLESLKVKNMVKNRKLARHISDASWGMFVEFLEYKAKWYGRTIVKIDQFFPSSKMCHVCENKNESLKLSDRKWQCELCQTVHDRDQNAAINIENEGCKVMAKNKDLKKVLSMLERRDTKHCGGGVSQGFHTLLPPMKQEAPSIAHL
jgi:putative transposase